MQRPPATVVRAAGGVVWRRRAGRIEVCLVHRPRYDDWSLPKGKVEPGEPPMVTAVREVAEEADVRAQPQVRLTPVRYAMRDGTPKVVDFWSMRAVGNGGFQVHTEVDATRWLPVDTAVDLVSYPHDVRVLREFAALPPVTAVLAVLRPAAAVAPADWPGPDADRPLTRDGLDRARALAPVLAVVRPQRLLSAPARRCVQTLDPLAALLDLPVETDPTLAGPEAAPVAAEGAHGNSEAAHATAGAAERLATLAAAGQPVVVCGADGLLPATLTRLTGRSPADYPTPTGTGWLVAFRGERVLAADALRP